MTENVVHLPDYKHVEPEPVFLAVFDLWSAYLRLQIAMWSWWV